MPPPLLTEGHGLTLLGMSVAPDWSSSLTTSWCPFSLAIPRAVSPTWGGEIATYFYRHYYNNPLMTGTLYTTGHYYPGKPQNAQYSGAKPMASFEIKNWSSSLQTSPKPTVDEVKNCNRHWSVRYYLCFFQDHNIHFHAGNWMSRCCAVCFA